LVQDRTFDDEEERDEIAGHVFDTWSRGGSQRNLFGVNSTRWKITDFFVS